MVPSSRDKKKAEELESRIRIPEDRAKLIQRRDGYMYFVSKICLCSYTAYASASVSSDG